MSLLHQNATRDEIEGEIVFNTVLITTLDPGADDYEEKKQEYEAVLGDLEARLGTLVSSNRPETPHSQPNGAGPSIYASGRSYDMPSREKRQQRVDPAVPPSPLSSYSNWNWPSEPTPAANQQSAIGSGISTPSSGGSNLNKRPRDSLQTYNSQKKSKRTSDTAEVSSASTPASINSIDQDDETFEKTYGKSLASNYDYIMKKMQEQEEERLTLLKAEQADAQMARQLAAQAGYSGGSTQASGSTAQSYFHPNGQWRRPEVASSARSSSNIPPFGISQNQVKMEGGLQAGLSQQQQKASHPNRGLVPDRKHAASFTQRPFTTGPPHPQYVPSSSLPASKLEDQQNESDEDLQVISSSQFAANVGSSGRLNEIQRASNHPSITNHSSGFQRDPNLPHYSAANYPPLPQTWDAQYDAMHQYMGDDYASSSSLQNNPMVGGSNVYGGYAPTAWAAAAMNGAQQAWNGVTSAFGTFANPFVDLGDDDDDQDNFGLSNSSAYPGRYVRPTLEDTLNARGLNHMLADTSRTKEDLEALLANIRPDEELPPEMRIGSPAQLTFPLMEHQKLGLAWLKTQEEGSNKGGILADDMGLGKTIQALALMVTRPSDDPGCKTTLIIAPVSLMRQWKKEIETKLLPRHRLNVYIMHGKQKNATFPLLSTYDVVITTFGTVSSEYSRTLKFMKRQISDPSAVRRRDEEVVLIGERSKWYRVIIDEAQMIKNKDTKAALGALQLNAQYRLCMTGTPMMNNIGELFSLIRFLRISPYNDLNRFNRIFKKPIEGRNEDGRDRAMKSLQGLLKAILLRRTKKSKVDGNPILQLPERTTEIAHAVFDEEQLAFYKAIENDMQLQVSKYLKAGKIGRNYSYILVRLLRLRQACCHPHLIKDFAQDGPGDVSKEEMLELVKALSPDVVTRIKDTNGQFECPICYDAVGNPTMFFPCGHDCCLECFAKVTDPNLAVAQGNENTEAKCPECRNKLDVKKVYDFNAFKEYYMPEEEKQEGGDDLPGVAAEEVDSDSEDDSDSDSSDDDDDDSDVDSQDDIRDFVVPDNAPIEDDPDDDEEEEKVKNEEKEEEEEADYQPADADADDSRPESSRAARQNQKTSKKPYKGKESYKGKGKGKEKKKKGAKKKTLADLRKEGLKNAAAKKRYLRRLRKDWVSSCKVDKTMEILRGIHEKSHDEKVIIFSQFTSFLDLLEVPIDEDGWNYRRYDGSMSAKLRNQAVDDFTEKSSCRIMLVSLKAGNAGLNLTAASQVIILDPFWNPFIEEQAIDRAHRIGQTRPVTVHRVLVEETVEDRIIALQEKKREMIEEALDEKAAQSVSRLGHRELRYLFGISNEM